MKSTRIAQSNIDTANLTIPAAEEIIEEALNELAYSQDPGLARALALPGPSRVPGHRGAVQRKRAQQAPQCLG